MFLLAPLIGSEPHAHSFEFGEVGQLRFTLLEPPLDVRQTLGLVGELLGFRSLHLTCFST